MGFGRGYSLLELQKWELIPGSCWVVWLVVLVVFLRLVVEKNLGEASNLLYISMVKTLIGWYLLINGVGSWEADPRDLNLGQYLNVHHRDGATP